MFFLTICLISIETAFIILYVSNSSAKIKLFFELCKFLEGFLV